MLLKKIILQANYLTSLNHFYKEVMSLPVLFSGKHTLEVQAGKTTLMFKKNGKAEEPYYPIAFNIPPHQFEEAFAWFHFRLSLLWVYDENSYEANFKTENAKSFYFCDPAGNIVEIIARYDLGIIYEDELPCLFIRHVSESGSVFPALGF